MSKESTAHLVVTKASWSIGGAAVAFALWMGYLELTDSRIFRQDQFDRRVEHEVFVEVDKWDFAKALYRELPSDINFLVRDLYISLAIGTTVRVFGPDEEDRFVLTVSPQEQTGPREFKARIRIDAITQTNTVGGIPAELVIKQESLTGPINAGTHAFYVFVEEVFTTEAKIAVAKRPAVNPAHMNYFQSMHYGSPILFGPEIPVPGTIITER